MTTLLNERIETGDVIEIVRGDDVVTAMVLLAADEAIILDTCDGAMPFVVKRDELLSEVCAYPNVAAVLDTRPRAPVN